MNPIYRFQFDGVSQNLLNPFAMVEGNLDTATGVVQPSDRRSTTDYMPVEANTSYKLMTSGGQTTGGTVCYYRADKSFISGEYAGIFNTPGAAAYMRVSFLRTLLPDIGVFASTAEQYEPYGIYYAYPLYGASLAKTFEHEGGQQFFRERIDGALQFVGPDYDMIASKDFDYKFVISIYVSYDAGQSWSKYWQGAFWKTDCRFDEDARAVTVTPTVLDQYEGVLAGIEKEWDLLELAPEIQQVPVIKRPCLQIYMNNANSLGQIIPGSNTYWETECEQMTRQQAADNHFRRIVIEFPVSLFFYNQSPGGRELVFSYLPLVPDVMIDYGPYTLTLVTENLQATLTRVSDGAKWHADNIPSLTDFVLAAVPGTPADKAYVEVRQEDAMYITARIIFDKVVEGAFTIGADDPVANNYNYHYCLPYMGDLINDLIVPSGRFSSTPTPYGAHQPGKYYLPPDDISVWSPVAPNTWGEYSVWISVQRFITMFAGYEQSYSTSALIKHAYPLASVISVLLGKIAPGITHDDTPIYSRFLYDANPITNITQKLVIAPKSNVITLGYDQPAQKAPITLKEITDMLRDCYRCYWFIDSSNRFRIEHISYFLNGRSYDPDYAQVGINLTEQTVSRNGKEWAFARSQYQFEKPEMAARYQFGWMDDVTQLFNGYPIDVISGYVNPDKIEQVSIAKFTSDIDYVMLSPGEISRDGFMLLGLVNSSVPIVSILVGGVNYRLQNGYLAFQYLQQFYAYDMPAKRYAINGVQKTALGLKRTKTQELTFPALSDPDLLKLVKTKIGNGVIQKLSINLSSRNAKVTLIYAPEQL